MEILKIIKITEVKNITLKFVRDMSVLEAFEVERIPLGVLV